ncbi:hypothetical protein Rsub_10485 [Raphidocelis subcapitata]|uniref:Uncharacterized protein n=1 Tax=Raphidocelis subcapitata TaxID=307507 RepID=A0A2V0PKL8_9CHLO|nr:hypothetical protein Rsub_10485 [Raphidocelis subcapitata]|eukprot:GBF98420.1 hypothetical protein Rsub_10485 [Raphidocelis subcapitata]
MPPTQCLRQRVAPLSAGRGSGSGADGSGSGSGEGRGGSSGAGGDDAFMSAALAEAVGLVRRAQELAAQQARSELMQSWQADGGGAASGGGSGGGGGGGGGTPPPAASREAVAAFLLEQGLAAADAARLAEAITDGGAFSGGGGGGAWSGGGGGGSEAAARGGAPSLAQLEAKWAGLRRVLPDADVASMVLREPALLGATSGELVGAVVALVAAFPSVDVQAMAEARPALLLLRDLPERCERVVAKLVELHPSGDRDVVAGVIEENPELLVRMDYYMAARLLDELPVELQNMFLPPGDTGLSWLYKYYSKKKGS